MSIAPSRLADFGNTSSTRLPSGSYFRRLPSALTIARAAPTDASVANGPNQRVSPELGDVDAERVTGGGDSAWRNLMTVASYSRGSVLRVESWSAPGTISSIF